MRIGISLLNLRPGKVGGIETYIRKVVELAPLAARGDEVVVFVHRDIRDLVPVDLATVVVEHSQRMMDFFRLLEAFTPWRARAIERMIEASGVDVMLYTQQTIFPAVCRIPSLLFVADVQYLVYPRYFSLIERLFRKRTYLKSLEWASHITSISQFTADQLVELCGVAPDKIDVIPLGYDPAEPPAAESSIVPDTPFFYYPAATFPHKGHLQLFRSYAQLKRNGQVHGKLVLTGDRSAYWKRLEKVIDEEMMQDEIIHLGYVSYQDVVALYRGAEAVLFPTEFEGFGLPVLEAVRFGKKIICSRLSVFSELGVPADWQIDFSDANQLLDALKREGTGPLSKEPLSWHDVIEKTFDLLRRIVREQNR